MEYVYLNIESGTKNSWIVTITDRFESSWSSSVSLHYLVDLVDLIILGAASPVVCGGGGGGGVLGCSRPMGVLGLRAPPPPWSGCHPACKLSIRIIANTILVSMTIMTHIIALNGEQSSQGTFEPGDNLARGQSGMGTFEPGDNLARGHLSQGTIWPGDIWAYYCLMWRMPISSRIIHILFWWLVNGLFYSWWNVNWLFLIPGDWWKKNI